MQFSAATRAITIDLDTNEPLTLARRRIKRTGQGGHASIGITAERYLHVYPDRDADAARAFERLVG